MWLAADTVTKIVAWIYGKMQIIFFFQKRLTNELQSHKTQFIHYRFSELRKMYVKETWEAYMLHKNWNW